jgi:O-acetyl-ADP-ribose deacetylase (regulator of RNase III)
MQTPTVDVIVVHGSILDVDAEVIVNAANSLGIMGGGVAGVIKRAAGQEVEGEARHRSPIALGSAVLTSGGATKFKGIIHAPTMSRPAMRISAANVALATKAALALSDEHRFQSIALPGMGTGVGGVSHVDAAATMLRAIKSYSPRFLKSVILVDVDEAMVTAWRAQLA